MRWTTLVLILGIAAGVSAPARGERLGPASDLEKRIERIVGFDRDEQGGKGLFLTVGKRALTRTRRSLSLGPFVGGAPYIGTENGGDFAFDLEFGLALLRYDIPFLPTPERIKDIVLDVVKDRLKERVKAAIARGENPTDADIKDWGREIRDRVVDEFLLKLRPKTFEDPSFQLRATVDRIFGEDAWNLRAGVGIGIGPVYLNAGTGLTVNSPVQALGFVELSLPILVSDGLRSPVVEPFVRFDAFTGQDDGRSDQIGLGARFMLDII